jgi:hypothetical protein
VFAVFVEVCMYMFERETQLTAVVLSFQVVPFLYRDTEVRSWVLTSEK